MSSQKAIAKSKGKQPLSDEDWARIAFLRFYETELNFANMKGNVGPVVAAARVMEKCLRDGGKVMFCGNGGSAADAQHLATEYVVRYLKNRRALPAVALTTDTSLLTAAGNDFGFEEIFARQVEALVRPQDLLIIHSTSGTSPNVVRAAEVARARGVSVLAFSARDGGTLRTVADHTVIVPTDRTDRAQELHLCLEHVICESVEEGYP
jgi:D-sedoheptulose 7-phosphate isomerase